MESVRTTTHIYPQEEIDNMRDFYHGKRCVITLNPETAVWAHLMDTSSDSSEPLVFSPHFLYAID